MNENKEIMELKEKIAAQEVKIRQIEQSLVLLFKSNPPPFIPMCGGQFAPMYGGQFTPMCGLADCTWYPQNEGYQNYMMQMTREACKAL